jgi:hypothetical protein
LATCSGQIALWTWSCFRLASSSRSFACVGLVGERHPRRFGPVATLAHMIERRRLRLVQRLRGTGKKELQI